MRNSIGYEKDMSELEVDIIATFRSFERIIKSLQARDILYYPSNPNDPIPDNGVIYVNKDGSLIACGKEVVGKDKIIGLLALAKHKQTDAHTLIDDAILNLYCVVHKSQDIVRKINNRLRKKGYTIMPYEFPGFNRIILLELAMNEWKLLRTSLSEQESAILCGFIALYAHLNKFSPWLLSDDIDGNAFSWDEWIQEHVSDSAGFSLGDTEVLKSELLENNITQATTQIIQGLKVMG